MKSLFSTIAFALMAFAVTAQTTIYAYRSYQPYDKADVTGPVKFPANDPVNGLVLIADQSKLGHVYAGTYYNYKWYGQVTHYGTQTTIDGLYTIDMNTGERTFVATSNRALSEMAVDYTTGTVYGIANGAANLATINLKTGTVVLGAPFTKEGGAAAFMVALECDLDGTMYGVSTDNNFYKIDKTTGVCTLVGNTGRDVAYTQTMAFDHHNHVLYWVNNGDYWLFTIDLETGKATPVGYTDSFNAMAIPYIHAPMGAPDRVTARQATISGSDVTLSWTNPVTDAQGKALANLGGVKVYRDNELIATVDLTSELMGQQSTYTDTGVAAGHHEYRLVPFNDKGNGGVDSDNVLTHVGLNPPGVVGNFTVTPGNYNAVLSWDAPSQGMYGGEFDPESITLYEITRIAGANRSVRSVKAPITTYTDKPGFGTYTYEVRAINEQGTGPAVTSAPVMVKYDNWIVMGDGEVSVGKDETFKFYDPGATGYYTNELDYTMTIKPADEGGLIDMVFTQFNLDVYGDTLMVYDGPDTKAPLVGKFTATKIPAELTHLRASNPSGALTFRFVSDIMVTSTGWLATVTETVMHPHDLEAGEITAANRTAVGTKETYTLAINNIGRNDVKAADFNVNLCDQEGNVLASASGVDIPSLGSGEVIVEYTADKEGDLSLKAVIEYAADGNLDNNTSATLLTTVYPVGTRYVQVQSHGTGVFIFPASFYSNESVWETVYNSNMIGVDKGELKLITFPVESTKNYTSIPVTIYMGETTKDNIADHIVPASQLTRVFEGNVPLRTTTREWIFPLDVPFEYNGGNLVIMMHKVAPNTNSQGVTFAGTYELSDKDPDITRGASTYTDDEHLDLEADFGWPSAAYPDINLLFTRKTSGVAGVATDDVRILAEGHNIIVLGAQDKAVTVYTIDGKIVASVDKASLVQNISLDASGLYIVKAGNMVAKVKL